MARERPWAWPSGLLTSRRCVCLGTAFLRSPPASLGATTGGANESGAWNQGWEVGFPSRKWA